MNATICVALLLLAGFGMLAAWRICDRKYEERIWRRLLARAGGAQGAFDPGSVDTLPGAAQRYFRYSIQPGTPLCRAVELDMEGELGFGTKERHQYRPMSARQLLAPPYGLVWKVKAGAFMGSDGLTPDQSWTRFWLLGIVPMVRLGGNEDHRRSAFGRLVAEATFWSPASLLPGDYVRWEELDSNTARAIVSFAGCEQAVDISLAQDGQPTRVVIQRWSNENPGKVFREQPFGGDLSDFRDFGGYRLPTRVEGGNHIATEDYFPFYRARVSAVRFRHEAGGA